MKLAFSRTIVIIIGSIIIRDIAPSHRTSQSSPPSPHLKLIPLNELVQVHAEQLEGDADVVAEDEVIDHVDHVVVVVDVLGPQVLQDLDLLLSLLVEPLLVPDHLQGHLGLGLVVKGLDHLPKAPFANHPEHLCGER